VQPTKYPTCNFMQARRSLTSQRCRYELRHLGSVVGPAVVVDVSDRDLGAGPVNIRARCDSFLLLELIFKPHQRPHSDATSAPFDERRAVNPAHDGKRKTVTNAFVVSSNTLELARLIGRPALYPTPFAPSRCEPGGT
jgi:hypothetical protein